MFCFLSVCYLVSLDHRYLIEVDRYLWFGSVMNTGIAWFSDVSGFRVSEFGESLYTIWSRKMSRFESLDHWTFKVLLYLFNTFSRWLNFHCLGIIFFLILVGIFSNILRIWLLWTSTDKNSLSHKEVLLFQSILIWGIQSHGSVVKSAVGTVWTSYNNHIYWIVGAWFKLAKFMC